jgi:hypothetical protein
VDFRGSECSEPPTSDPSKQKHMASKLSETLTTSSIDIRNQLIEDPFRQPHEKESVFALAGDDTHFEVTSFKKVVYGKLIQRPEFDLKWLNVRDADGRETTVSSYKEVAEQPKLQVIGVVGRIPVGAFTVGSPRNSNSHAKVVK